MLLRVTENAVAGHYLPTPVLGCPQTAKTQT